MNWRRLLSAIVLTTLTFICATAVAQSKNKPPSIDDIDAPAEVDVGERADLSVSASDPDGDKLSYSWDLKSPTNSDSQLNGSKPSSRWFLTDKKGQFVATVTVDDGNGGKVERTIVVRATAMPSKELDHLNRTQQRSIRNAGSISELRQGLQKEVEKRKKADEKLRKGLKAESDERKAADEEIRKQHQEDVDALSKRDDELEGVLGDEVKARRAADEQHEDRLDEAEKKDQEQDRELRSQRKVQEDLVAPISGSLGLGGGLRTFTEDSGDVHTLGVGFLEARGFVQFGTAGVGLVSDLGIEAGSSPKSPHLGARIGGGPWVAVGPLRLNAQAKGYLALVGEAPTELGVQGGLTIPLDSKKNWGLSAEVGYGPLAEGMVAWISFGRLFGWD